MANRYSGIIVTVDTTDTQVGGDNPTSGMPKGALKIKQIFWQGNDTSGKDIAADDDLTILIPDLSGNEQIALRAANIYNDGTRTCIPQYYPIVGPFAQPWIIAGLYVEDLDGGELVIVLE